MADRVFPAETTTTAFREASHWWRSIVGAVEDHQWDRPALGEWTVRELVAHGARAYRTVLEYSEGEAKDPTPIATPAQYFRIVLAEQTPHLHIAARARREAGTEANWVTATDELAGEAERVVAESPADLSMHLFVGEMPLAQYLATRVVELVVHGLDLAAAIDLPVPPPPGAGRVALDVLLDLGVADDLGAVLRLLTGRPASLPLANVLA